MFTPFALELYCRHLKGDSIEQLSLELGITVERIEQRLKAAAIYAASHTESSALAATS